MPGSGFAELMAWIETRVGAYWVKGRTLFYGHLPKLTTLGQTPPLRCAVLAHMDPGVTDGQLPDFAEFSFQVWNRHKDYPSAEEDAYHFFWILHGQAGLNLPVLTSGEEWTAMVIDAIGRPTAIGNPEEEGFWTFATNYICRLEAPALSPY